MKIENTGINTNTAASPNVINKKAAKKGVLENSENRIRELEAQRVKQALDTSKTLNVFTENRGTHIDSKA